MSVTERHTLSWVDNQAVIAVLYRYAEHVDDGDFVGAAALFAVDGALCFALGDALPSHPTVGPTAIAASLRSAVQLYDGTPRTLHVVSNPIVETDAGAVMARSYFTVFQATPDLALQAIACGRYQDTFQRSEDDWLIARRIVRLIHTGDMSRHILDQAELA